MPDYSDWAREISEGSEERRVGVLEGIIEQLEVYVDDKDNENGPYVLLAKETELVAALISLACDSSAFGYAATNILSWIAKPDVNRLPLLQFPGLIDALITTPHVNTAIATLHWVTAVNDEAQLVAIANNTALVDRLVANVGRNKNATNVLFNLCSSDNNAALLYAHPGLIAAVTDATRVPACVRGAVAVLGKMACTGSLMMPMLRSPLVLDALLRAACSDIAEVFNLAFIGLNVLSLKSENHALMRDDARIMNALTARTDHAVSKPLLVRICYIGGLPWPRPTLDLSLLCSHPFHHQLSLIKVLIREHPEQLSVQDSTGRTPLVLAQAAPLPAPIIGLLSGCVTTSTLTDFSLAHLVGYKRSQRALVRAQRHTLMCCLVHLANAPAQPAAEDSPGALNPGKALKGYLTGGIDPWSIIGPFAF
ncbi:hypothetical protein TeGR_g11045 [Tetraparma gracilis]|uniref:Uncharacterized protein n=1 Tax=Tetraparma gracilis TaxID=2962635 RepID=A0ABQ6MNI6_9STRA|nr:hypothetical protein TeGR_g11045 [Tetraparma gracilis]